MEIKFPTLQMKLCCIITPLPLPLPPPHSCALHLAWPSISNMHVCVGWLFFVPYTILQWFSLGFLPFPCLWKNPPHLKIPSWCGAHKHSQVNLRDGPLEKLWGGRGIFDLQEFFFVTKFLVWIFFRPLHEYFLGVNWLARIFFHLIFPCANFFFVLRPPPQ